MKGGEKSGVGGHATAGMVTPPLLSFVVQVYLARYKYIAASSVKDTFFLFDAVSNS